MVGDVGFSSWDLNQHIWIELFLFQGMRKKFIFAVGFSISVQLSAKSQYVITWWKYFAYQCYMWLVLIR